MVRPRNCGTRKCFSRPALHRVQFRPPLLLGRTSHVSLRKAVFGWVVWRSVVPVCSVAVGLSRVRSAQPFVQADVPDGPPLNSHVGRPLFSFEWWFCGFGECVRCSTVESQNFHRASVGALFAVVRPRKCSIRKSFSRLALHQVQFRPPWLLGRTSHVSLRKAVFSWVVLRSVVPVCSVAVGLSRVRSAQPFVQADVPDGPPLNSHVRCPYEICACTLYCLNFRLRYAAFGLSRSLLLSV